MPELRLYNTLTRGIETFVPLDEGKVGLYTCGPTVYGAAHIGNLRTFLFEDLLRRALRLLGYDVEQVMNLTDIDDKVIQRAAEAGLGLDEFTAPFIEAFHQDLARLNVDPAEHYPRATRHIPEMIALIERLVERGYAYESEGSVYFRIAEDEDYGRLARVDLEQARRGERVASDTYSKEDARDFVLWKGAKPGEPTWDSPWGPGRPGWHIECSAMSMSYLGETFDIHCGGVDNIFPHHDNEIAQSESATGHPFVRYWLHSEHLIVDGEKMSKSLGNQYTLDELLQRGISPRSLRYLFLSVHYRQKLNFTFDAIGSADNALRRLDEMRFRLEHAAEAATASTDLASAAGDMEKSFRAALANDLNISEALAALFALVKRVNVVIEEGPLAPGDRERIEAALAVADSVLGVLDPTAWDLPAGEDDEEIERLVEERATARRERDFATADRLREELDRRGIVIEDTADGTRWRRR